MKRDSHTEVLGIGYLEGGTREQATLAMNYMSSQELSFIPGLALNTPLLWLPVARSAPLQQ